MAVDYSNVFAALNEPNGRTHKYTQVLMTYKNPAGHDKAHVVNPGTEAGAIFLLKTIRWASNHRVTISILPHG